MNKLFKREWWTGCNRFRDVKGSQSKIKGKHKKIGILDFYPWHDWILGSNPPCCKTGRIADLDNFFRFHFHAKKYFWPKQRLKWPFSGCSFILPMNLFSSKRRHNNLIVIITQISNLSKNTNKVESSLEPPFPPRCQKHRNMIQKKVNLFSPFFPFFPKNPFTWRKQFHRIHNR